MGVGRGHREERAGVVDRHEGAGEAWREGRGKEFTTEARRHGEEKGRGEEREWEREGEREEGERELTNGDTEALRVARSSESPDDAFRAKQNVIMLDDKSIEEIEGAFWDDRGDDEWPLVRRVLAARKKPLRDLTTENLRLLIGQNVALEIVVPRAIAVLTMPHERTLLESIVRKLDVDAAEGMNKEIRDDLKEKTELFLKDGRTT